MRFCFAFNAMVDQTYMPVEKQEINIELGLLPLVDLLERHPRVRSALFFTGYTDQILAAHWPDLVRRIKQGVGEGRYEIGTYTYTHPLLSLIPYEDVYRQLTVGLDIDEDVWGIRPRGTILPEGSWDPSLAKVFADVGIAWTMISSTAYLQDHPKASSREVYRPVALTGTFGANVPALFASALSESLWAVTERQRTADEYISRIEQVIADGGEIYIDKSDAEFLYLALPRLTDTPFGEGTRSQVEPYVAQANALLSRLEDLAGLEFTLVTQYLAQQKDLQRVLLRPGMGWKDLTEWTKGSEKVAAVTDEARQEIKTAQMVLVLAEKVGLNTTKAHEHIQQAWAWLMRAETSIGRRACAHPKGQPSRIIDALENAARARESARQALDGLEALTEGSRAGSSQAAQEE